MGINDNKRTSRTSYQLLPPLDFSRFHRTFPDFPDHIRIPSPFPQTRSWRVWCSFVTNGNIWPNGFKWPRTLVSHAIKSFCSMNAFNAASNNLRHTLKSMDRSKSQLAWCVMCFGTINPFIYLPAWDFRGFQISDFWRRCSSVSLIGWLEFCPSPTFGLLGQLQSGCGQTSQIAAALRWLQSI